MSYPDIPSVCVVSGLPRSGTSMAMRMLQAGGVDLLTDSLRPADESNPRGYYEYDPARRLKRDGAWMAKAVGKAVKVISYLLPHLPSGYQYRVIFMHRPLPEVLASQRVMMERGGMAEEGDDEGPRAAFLAHLGHIRPWLEQDERFSVLDLQYHEVIADPMAAATAIAHFLNRPLDTPAMAAAVEPGLWRQQCGRTAGGRH